MKKFLAMLAVMFTVTACGERVEVKPAHVGKILTKHGYQEGFVDPSQFRLELCFAYCDKLITLQTSDAGVRESMQLFMPKDQLNMKFDVRATVRIARNSDVIDKIFDRVPAGNDDHISLGEVYTTYAEQKFRSVTRSVLAAYSINTIAANREAVESQLRAKLGEALSETPIQLVNLGLADVQFPEVITRAKELAKEREVAIEQAKAEKLVSLEKAQAELELARKDRLVRLEKAKTIKEENELTARSVTPKYLEYKRLEVLEEIAKNGNQVYIPMDTNLFLMNK